MLDYLRYPTDVHTPILEVYDINLIYFYLLEIVLVVFTNVVINIKQEIMKWIEQSNLNLSFCDFSHFVIN